MRATAKHFAIFGDPVTHSISPLMHNYALKGLDIDACYTRYRLKEGVKLREKFLSLQLEGINITVPHKEAAYRACDEIRGIAREIEAINTIVLERGRLIGYNTDAPGFLDSALAFGKIQNVCIIGAGGTAKAIAVAFKEKGIDVTLLNRSQGRLDYFNQKGFRTFTWEQWQSKAYDLVVNTTSAGLIDQTLPAPEAITTALLQNTKYAIDVIYNKNTPFIQLAKKLAIPVKDGSEMLLYQGVYALELFLSHKYTRAQLLPWMQKAFT